jgi:hypothetical protein
VRDAVREGLCLTRSSPCDDQQGVPPVLNGEPLLRVETSEVVP